jgi:hypothetical protein
MSAEKSALTTAATAFAFSARFSHGGEERRVAVLLLTDKLKGPQYNGCW